MLSRHTDALRCGLTMHACIILILTCRMSEVPVPRRSSRVASKRAADAAITQDATPFSGSSMVVSAASRKRGRNNKNILVTGACICCVSFHRRLCVWFRRTRFLVVGVAVADLLLLLLCVCVWIRTCVYKCVRVFTCTLTICVLCGRVLRRLTPTEWCRGTRCYAHNTVKRAACNRSCFAYCD
jgi:hypothetical protein